MNTSVQANTDITSYTTNRRQLYMLPTKAGWIFSFMVFALFLASIKFSHQPTFLLTFLLSAIAITSSLHTHRNISKLTISPGNATPCFVDETLIFPVTLHNSLNNHRRGIWLVCGDFQESIDVPPNSTVSMTIKLKAPERGQFDLPKIILTTHYPIGILFSWSRAFLSRKNALVYPKPLDFVSLPQLQEVETEDKKNISTSQSSHSSGEQVSSLKNYQQGDRLKDIHWPALAKTGKLISKEYDRDSEQRLIFAWQDVETLSLEEKLSQLTHWVVMSHKARLSYQLSIPGFTSTYGNGESHQNICLEALALTPKNV